jgi:hypothetical protein
LAMLLQGNRICILTVRRYSGGYISTCPPPGFYSDGGSPQSAVLPRCHPQNRIFGLPVGIAISTVPVNSISNAQRAMPHFAFPFTHESGAQQSRTVGRIDNLAIHLIGPSMSKPPAASRCNYGQAAVIHVGSDSCGVGQHQQQGIKQFSQVKRVRWAPTVASTLSKPAQGGRSAARYMFHYNSESRTTAFVLNVRFGDHFRISRPDSIKLRANLLLEFEYCVAMRFPEDTRRKLMNAMNNGYALVFCGSTFKKRTSILIRGASLVLPDAASNSFLNCVPENATVVLEWL